MAWDCNSSDWAQRCSPAGISGQFHDRVRPGPVPNASRARRRTQQSAADSRTVCTHNCASEWSMVTGAIRKIKSCFSDKRSRACALLLTCIRPCAVAADRQLAPRQVSMLLGFIRIYRRNLPLTTFVLTMHLGQPTRLESTDMLSSAQMPTPTIALSLGPKARGRCGRRSFLRTIHAAELHQGCVN
jgi:hypothetical protein